MLSTFKSPVLGKCWGAAVLGDVVQVIDTFSRYGEHGNQGISNTLTEIRCVGSRLLRTDFISLGWTPSAQETLMLGVDGHVVALQFCPQRPLLSEEQVTVYHGGVSS